MPDKHRRPDPNLKATKLLPGPTEEIPAYEIHQNLKLPDLQGNPPGNLPYVLLNTVSSIDGRVAVNGRSGGIGSAVDRATMRNLRSHVDAVAIGAGSLRAEKMDLGVPQEIEDLRLKRNLEPQPTAIILSRSGDVPLQNLVGASRPPSKHFGQTTQKILVFKNNTYNTSLLTGADYNEHQPREHQVSYIEADASNVRYLLATLKIEFGIYRVLFEGGPTVSHALVSAGLLDELFITLAPVLLAGEPQTAPALLSGPSIKEYQDSRGSLTLLSTHIAGSEIFLRYSLHSASYSV